MPLQPRHEYAAGFPRGLPADDANRPRSSTHHHDARARCCPAQICQISSWWILLRSVQPLVSHVHLPVSLAGPGPSDSAGPSRRCRGCLPPIPVRLDGVGCPQLHATRCDEPRAVSFHHRTVQSASWRSASQIQIRSHSHGTWGRAAITGRGRNGSPGNWTLCLSATRSTVDGDTNTVPV
jgi:hypothetical protein